MEVQETKCPNGDPQIDMRGWHDENCPLDAVLWCLYPEDGWTLEKVAESWNRRWEEA